MKKGPTFGCRQREAISSGKQNLTKCLQRCSTRQGLMAAARHAADVIWGLRDYATNYFHQHQPARSIHNGLQLVIALAQSASTGPLARQKLPANPFSNRL